MSRPERESRMLDAAEKAFATQPFAAASMEQIARDSGITKAMLYQYFGSKEGLYDATVERGRAELFDALRDAVEGQPSGLARTEAFVRGYVDYVAANRGRWWLLYGQASSPAVNAMRERNAELISDLLGDTLAEAGRTVDAEAVAVLAHALVGAGEQIGRWWAARPDVEQEVVVKRFLAVVSGAIAGVLAESTAIEGS